MKKFFDTIYGKVEATDVLFEETPATELKIDDEMKCVVLDVDVHNMDVPKIEQLLKE